LASVFVRLKVTGADRTRLYWSLQKKCPSPRWKRRASARRKRPPPQMALATASMESATRAKSPLFGAAFAARLKPCPSTGFLRTCLSRFSIAAAVMANHFPHALKREFPFHFCARLEGVLHPRWYGNSESAHCDPPHCNAVSPRAKMNHVLQPCCSHQTGNNELRRTPPSRSAAGSQARCGSWG